jgi:hypothetical protein
MHASTTAKALFRNLTISGTFPCEIETHFFGSKQDESASTRQTYPHESVAIIGESYSARNNMKVVEEPFLPIFFYYCAASYSRLRCTIRCFLKNSWDGK